MLTFNEQVVDDFVGRVGYSEYYFACDGDCRIGWKVYQWYTFAQTVDSVDTWDKFSGTTTKLPSGWADEFSTSSTN